MKLLAGLTMAATFSLGLPSEPASPKQSEGGPAAPKQSEGGPLPQTAALDWPEEDLSGRMMDGAHRFVERQIAETQARSERFWKYDRSSPVAWNAAIEANRDRLREIIGVVDSRLSSAVERYGDDENPALVAETNRYRVYQVRWPVLDGISAEGLLVEPAVAAPAAHIVAVPDAGQDPEQILGLAPGLPAERQFARLLADAGCELLIPVLIRRELIPTTDAQLEKSQQTWREWLYRQAFHMGRHPIGYEVQKVLAAVDGFRARRGETAKVGVVGYAEGGLVAFYAAAIDRRIDAALVSGYFDRRGRVWEEPIDRNVWSLLERFGDAEIASLGPAAPSRDRTRRESVVHEQQGSPSHAVWIVGPRRVRPHSESRRLHASFAREWRWRSTCRTDVHHGARRFRQAPRVPVETVARASGIGSPSPVRSGRHATPAARAKSSGTSSRWCARRSTSAIRVFCSPCCLS